MSVSFKIVIAWSRTVYAVILVGSLPDLDNAEDSDYGNSSSLKVVETYESVFKFGS